MGLFEEGFGYSKLYIHLKDKDYVEGLMMLLRFRKLKFFERS